MGRAAVIGLGVGGAHAAAYAEHPDAELVALCDADEERLREVATAHPGVRVTTDPAEILGDPDIEMVSIASYDSDHHRQVMGAIRNGKHVFVEKPLCQTEEQASEIHAALAARPELVLSSNLLLRASPRFQLVKRWLDEGRFGHLYYMEGDYDYGRLWKLTEGWRGDLESYSVTLGGTIHLIDLLLWLSRDRPVSAQATGNGLMTRDSKFRFDDLVVAVLELESGATMKVAANFGCTHPHFHDVKLFGRDATFVNGLEQATLWTAADGKPERELVDADYPGVEKGALVASFVEAVAGRGAPPVPADDVFDVLATCFAIDRAAQTGERQAVTRFG